MKRRGQTLATTLVLIICLHVTGCAFGERLTSLDVGDDENYMEDFSLGSPDDTEIFGDCKVLKYYGRWDHWPGPGSTKQDYFVVVKSGKIARLGVGGKGIHGSRVCSVLSQ